MEIRFNPNDAKCGVVSEASWGNPDVQKALRGIFGTRSDETLVMLDVTAEGLRAYFAYDPASEAASGKESNDLA